MTTSPTPLYWLTADHTVERCLSMEDWGRWMEDVNNRRVAETTLHDGRWVSTVFLGLDHQFGPSATPLLFETMVFTGEGSGQEEACERYATWDEAYKGHWWMVRERTLSLCEEVS